jgi:3'(2'), 5'-bisphosphate nucleotidase
MGAQKINTEQIVEKVNTLLLEAGEVCMQLYKTDVAIEKKKDASPVTEADLRVNDILLQGLESFGWPILSEETADTDARLASDYVWIIDPIDGTRDFIEHTGEFCIMVGLVYKQKPILGWVYVPVQDALYVGGVDVEAHKIVAGKTTSLSVSKESVLSNASMVASFSHYNGQLGLFAEKAGIAEMIRMGSNGLKVAVVADATVSLFFTTATKMGEWDICGPQAIVEAAGGTVTGLGGEPLLYNKKDPHTPYGFLITNGLIHEQARTILSENQITPDS